MGVPQLYAEVIGDTVVAKRAAGPREDGTYPVAKRNWVTVSPEDFTRVQSGWRVQPDGTFVAPAEPDDDRNDPVRPDSKTEKLWRKEAMVRVVLLELRNAVQALRAESLLLRAAVKTLDERVTALEQAAPPSVV